MAASHRNRTTAANKQKGVSFWPTGIKITARDAYSKKFEYLIHSINLMIFYYNFVWVHGTHGKTPAQAIGLKADAMTFEDLLMWQD
jgi:hypothetical protein